MLRAAPPPTKTIPPSPAGPVAIAPVRRPVAQPQDMLTTLYQQLKQAYPHIPDADLMEGAKRLLSRLQQQQSDEFYKQLFPERATQTATPNGPAPVAPQPGQQMVAQNEQTPWRWTGSGVQFAGSQENDNYKQAQAEAKRLMLERENANYYKQQAAKQAASKPGQAQPIQPPPAGTPYKPEEPIAAADPEVAALNAQLPAGPGIPKRYYRQPDGTIGMAQ